MLVGYARVSSVGQSLDTQIDLLATAGCEKTFSEKMTGTSMADRSALAEAVEFVREGDILVVTRLDRLARSSVDLHNLIARLAVKKVGFKCLQQAGVDTDSGMGKLVLAILGAVAEFETDIRKDRQAEGIARAKGRGVYKGRKRSVAPDEVRSLRNEGLGATEIAARLKIGRASVYRALKSGDPG